jgi:hypothetical protein
VRRLIVALTIVAVITATGVIGPTMTLGTTWVDTASASAQEPGQPTCGPMQTAWYVSSGSWWYAWVWRWCYNASEQNPWYVDWVSWYWGDYAGLGYTPGYQYSVPYITQ